MCCSDEITGDNAPPPPTLDANEEEDEGEDDDVVVGPPPVDEMLELLEQLVLNNVLVVGEPSKGFEGGVGVTALADKLWTAVLRWW